mmetsp:Transcript_23552/g.50861  ORF Transcript_23552/g.50861 Transcript_23552/m.50861 type:complete len:101 (+) Transcript_23552:2654-2956(+)
MRMIFFKGLTRAGGKYVELIWRVIPAILGLFYLGSCEKKQPCASTKRFQRLSMIGMDQHDKPGVLGCLDLNLAWSVMRKGSPLRVDFSVGSSLKYSTPLC